MKLRKVRYSLSCWPDESGESDESGVCLAGPVVVDAILDGVWTERVRIPRRVDRPKKL